MKLPLLVIGCLAVFTCCAQSTATATGAALVYNRVQQMPQFPGGNKVLAQLLTDSIDLPKIQWEELKDDDLNTYIKLSFIIDEQGNVSDVKVLHTMNKTIDDKLVSVVKKLKFIPGKQDGKPVKVRYILPFDYGYLTSPR